jgi:hypothetical protein
MQSGKPGNSEKTWVSKLTAQWTRLPKQQKGGLRALRLFYRIETPSFNRIDLSKHITAPFLKLQNQAVDHREYQ